jgi:hypothetical protein
MVEQKIVPATGHTEVTIPAVEPTYTEDGATEGKQCSTCGAITVAPVIVPATDVPEVVGDTGCKSAISIEIFAFLFIPIAIIAIKRKDE